MRQMHTGQTPGRRTKNAQQRLRNNQTFTECKEYLGDCLNATPVICYPNATPCSLCVTKPPIWAQYISVDLK